MLEKVLFLTFSAVPHILTFVQLAIIEEFSVQVTNFKFVST
jgi:hypothetical protein